MQLRLRTERLTLRPVTLSDAEETAALMTVDVARSLQTWNAPTSVSEARNRIATSKESADAGTGVDFAILQDNRLIGWIGGRRTGEGGMRLGYWIGSPYQGLGFAKEAAEAAIPVTCAFLRAEQIEAEVQRDNARSIRLLLSLGFNPPDTGKEEGETQLFRKRAN